TLIDDPSLTAEARTAIEEKQNLVAVSAAPVWEISIKHRTGKLRPPVGDVVADLGRQFPSLPITSGHARAAGASAAPRRSFRSDPRRPSAARGIHARDAGPEDRPVSGCGSLRVAGVRIL